MRFLFKIETAILFFLAIAIGSAIVYMIPISLLIKHDLDFSKISIASAIFLFSIGFLFFFVLIHMLKKFSNSRLNLYKMNSLIPLTILVALQVTGPANLAYLIDIKYANVSEYLPIADFDANINFARFIQLSRIFLGVAFNQFIILIIMIPILFVYYFIFGRAFNFFRQR